MKKKECYPSEGSLNNLEAVLFDFDGVIVESLDVKTWAMAELFKDYPQQQKEIVAYHEANGGVSRFEKFPYIYRNILKQPLSEEQLHALCQKFSRLVEERVIQSDFVPGALEFLEEYHHQWKFFIISGTPQKEIERIVNAKKLNKYFCAVCGSPQQKGDWTKHILDQYRFDRRHVIFVGDALSDYEAARENAIRFVGRIFEHTNNIFAGKKIDYTIGDLFDLKKLVHA